MQLNAHWVPDLSFADTFPTHNPEQPFCAKMLLGRYNTYLSILHIIEIKVEDDLLAPGAKAGTIPTDLDQSTGLERLELIGKMQGIDIFDMRPLDASRKGMSP